MDVRKTIANEEACTLVRLPAPRYGLHLGEDALVNPNAKKFMIDFSRFRTVTGVERQVGLVSALFFLWNTQGCCLNPIRTIT